LLLDEPTSLQDHAQAAWLRQELAGRGEAMIWATQQAEEVAACHRVLSLHGGRPEPLGSATEALARPHVRRLLEPRYGVARGPGERRRPTAPATAAAAPTAPAAVEAGETVAELQGIRCAFPDGRDLSVARWTVRRGERIGIVGPNGCGKSTLLAVLAGLRPPDRGEATLAGRHLYARGGRDLDHGACALAPQLPEYLLTRSDVAGEIALDPGLARRDPAAVLATAGLTPQLLPRHPHDLSGGQRRRLALALALASGRPLVLLDEPTAALDADGRVLVARQVAALPADAALVIASHDRAFLDACGCTLLDLTGGRLAPLHG
jgi:ATPase subunit of ABC transporter with duplicated ATPase domains